MTFDGNDSLFNGIVTNSGAYLVGVNGAIVRYTDGESELTRIPGGGASALGDVDRLDDTLVLGGETGLNHLAIGR